MSSVAYLSSELKKNGAKVTAIHTFDTNSLPAYYPKPDATQFDSTLYFNSQSIDSILTQLKNADFDFVINGSDRSVEIADQLARHFTPDLSNDCATYQFRSDKYQMHRRLSEAGISHIRQFLHSRNQPEPDLRQMELKYPIFVKPLCGLGSAGSCRIDGPLELKRYFRQDFTSIDSLNFVSNRGVDADMFLVSECIFGEEYLVDTFSFQGNHYFSSVQKYVRSSINGSPAFRCCELVAESQLSDRIKGYIESVLDATQFKNGLAHTELFVTPDGEIKLIEINPRISGARGLHNKLASMNGKPSQLDLMFQQLGKNPDLKASKSDSDFVKAVVLYGSSDIRMKDYLSSIKIRYSCVSEVIQLVSDGFVKHEANYSLSDAAAFLVCGSSDSRELEEQVAEILYEDIPPVFTDRMALAR